MPRITCPHCELTKEMPDHTVPPRPARVTCPRCGGSFRYPDHAPAVSPPTGGLTDIGDLFARSWEIYRRRLGTLIPLSFISLLVVFLPIVFFMGGGYFVSMFVGYPGAFAIAGAATGILVAAVAMIWAMAALTFAAVDESLGIKGSMSSAWSTLGSFVWLFSILPFVIFGGYFLFIIPGIIFSVLFVFAQYILADENVRGMNAMLKSREYVRGYGWPVFLRLVVLWLTTGLVTALLNLAPVIGAFASYFVTPYIFIFTALIYRDLKCLKPDVSYDSSAGTKSLWLLLGTLGFVVVIAAFATMVTAGLFSQMHIR